MRCCVRWRKRFNFNESALELAATVAYATSGVPRKWGGRARHASADIGARPQSRLGRRCCSRASHGARVAALNLQVTPSPPSPAAVGEPPAGLLDAGALDRLRALDPQGRAGLLPRVLATYTASLQRLLEQLRLARACADLQGQRHVAHTLKSSSASVGAMKLAALCADVERQMRDEPAEPVHSQFDAVAREAEHLLLHLRS